ncbi:MAG: ArnT family glycosyltransferase, partial [Minisyncoccales bacterium]
MKKKNRKFIKQSRQSTKLRKRLFKKKSFVPNRQGFPWLKYLFIFLIFSLAVFFRIYKISDVPPSLNWDEVSHGYNAYSIFKTGKDEWGISWPLIFRAYGDYKLPLYIYLTVPPVGLGGINSLTVRVVSILSGLGVVVIAYLITKRITQKEVFSLFAAFLAAISPWSLFVSRVALEANLAAFLFSLAIYFWLSWVEDLKEKDLTWSGFFWGLSLYAYNSARVLVPFFVFLTIFFAIRKKIKFLSSVTFFLLILIFYFPLIFQFLNRSALARFDNVFLIDQGLVDQIISFRNNTYLPAVISRLIYNRPSFFLYYSFRNYLANLSPWYLFFRGGSQYQFSLPQHELLYLVTAPFLFLGLIKILIKGNKKEKLVGFWFFVSFIPSAITKDAPHVLRSILILPSPMILTALGLQLTVNFLKEKSKFGGRLLISVLILTVLVSFGRWWKDYLTIYPKAYSWAW